MTAPLFAPPARAGVRNFPYGVRGGTPSCARECPGSFGVRCGRGLECGRDANACRIEPGLDALSHRSSNEPLLKRCRLEHDSYDGSVLVETLDPPHFGRLDDDPVELGVLEHRGRFLLQDCLHLVEVSFVADRDVEDRTRPVLALVADPQHLAVADVPDRAVAAVRQLRRPRWPRRGPRRRRRRTGPPRS